MTVNFLIYGVFVYFIGLALSGVFSLSKRFFKNSLQLFVFINFLGFLLGLIYFFNFAPQQIVLANWSSLFAFSPTVTLLGAVFFTLISGVSALVGVYSVRYLELYKETYNPLTTQFLTAFFVLGMQGVMFANNVFMFLFFWEVMSITSFFLVFADKSGESFKAAFLYFIMTHLGASAILGGFLILSGGNILFDFANITSAAGNLSPALAALAFVLFLFGFGSKAGLVPFHVWLPEAHPQAPSNISALMSGLMLKVAVYGFIKVVFALTNLPNWAGLMVIALGLFSSVVGVLYAVIERDMKRAFAYSSIENMGIIFTMLGVSIYLLAQNGPVEMIAFSNLIVVFAIFHAINHALFKTALFLSSGVVISRFHSRRLEIMGGLAKIMPLFSFAFLIAILSSLALPPFGTFYGEWGLIQSILNLLHMPFLSATAMIILLVVLALLGLVSGLAVFAMVKIFGISMLGLPRTSHFENETEKRDYLLIFPILVLAIGVIVLGIFAKTIIAWLVSYGDVLATVPAVAVSVPSSQISSVMVFLFPAIVLFGTWALFKVLSREKLEREYKTWDCGQAIDASMQYSSTAFSAPIRFFFLHLLGRDKVLKSKPILATNPWIRDYTFSMSLKSIWKDKLYQPVSSILNALAERVKVLQGGRIQYYLLFVLGTLIVTLIIVL